MNRHNLICLIVAGHLVIGLNGFAQINGVEVAGGATAQVFGGKTPVVRVVDAEGKELASIPLGKNPGTFVYSKSANKLYISETEKSELSISVIDLANYRVAKTIETGTVDESPSRLYMSDDGTRLFVPAKGKSKGDDPLVYVIDTGSNEIITTYDWFSGCNADLPKHRFLFKRFIASDDGSHFIVICEAYTTVQEKKLKYQMSVFSGNYQRPAFSFNPSGDVVATIFSNNEKLLIAAVSNGSKTDGSLEVFDLEKGTSVTHQLSDHPIRFFRLGSNQEPWIMSSEEMRVISESGEPGARRIPLNKEVKSEDSTENAKSAFLDGFPGETLNLGGDFVAIQIDNKAGGSRHKVALINLSKLRVDAIIHTMSAGELARIRTEHFLASYAMGMATAMATGGVIAFYTSQNVRNESLASNPGGHLLFTLDLEAHLVTVVDVQNAVVVKRIPVNNSVTKLKVSADGSHLICFGTKVQQIDLATNNLED